MTPKIPAARGIRRQNPDEVAHGDFMASAVHALNVMTMAAWLSVAGFTLLAAINPNRKLLAIFARPPKIDALNVTLDATTGEKALSLSGGSHIAPAPPLRPLPVFRSLARPPAMPNLPVTAPLPEIPKFPSLPRATPAAQAAWQPTASGTSPNHSSVRERFAAGYTPEAPYPPYSSRNHQEGTVIVEFTVNSAGIVTAVFVKQPCQWPLLNRAAVGTVYNWRFPPGDFISLECPIVFRLK